MYPSQLTQIYAMKINIYRNPFILGIWAPAYLLIATTTILNDFLLAALFIMATLGIIGAYVSDFPIFSGLYMNEIGHKTAIASLAGLVTGMVLFLVFASGGDTSATGPISPGGKFFMTWAVMSAPGYILMTFLVSRVNKRDLEAEERIRKEKRLKRKAGGGGPPIMNRDGF